MNYFHKCKNLFSTRRKVSVVRCKGKNSFSTTKKSLLFHARTNPTIRPFTTNYPYSNHNKLLKIPISSYFLEKNKGRPSSAFLFTILVSRNYYSLLSPFLFSLLHASTKCTLSSFPTYGECLSTVGRLCRGCSTLACRAH